MGDLQKYCIMAYPLRQHRLTLRSNRPKIARMKTPRTRVPESPLLRAAIDACAAWGTPAWLVGGAVRDILLGRPVHDFDIAVAHGGIDAARDAASRLRAPMYVLDAERDTARVVTFDAAGVRTFLDFAQLRAATIEADLAQRDFTVNAIAIDLAQPDRLIDPFGGQRDLKAGILRAVGDTSLSDDPARLLRAARLAAGLAMRIEPATEKRIRRAAHLITLVSAERVRDELAQIVELPNLHENLLALERLGLLPELLPEVAAMRGVAQSPPHHWDVREHTLRLLDLLETLLSRLVGLESQAPTAPPGKTAPAGVWLDVDDALAPMRDALRTHFMKALSDERPAWSILKWAALLHDVGKPITRSVDPDGRNRFLEHETASTHMAAERLRRLRFSTGEIERVALIIQHHMRPHHLAESGMSRRAAYRFFRDTGEAGVDVLLLSLVDHLATHGPDLDAERWACRLDLARGMLDEYFNRRAETISPPALISGHDVMSGLGLKPGRQVGELLEAVREAQAAGEVRTREEALELARKLKRDEG